ncbi:Uncharacterised protein [Bordetella pertussis]|nr:Uncharacterised protein [Bordetella pertussis]
MPTSTGAAGLHLRAGRGYRLVQQCAPPAQRWPPAAGRRRARRSIHQLLRLRLPGPRHAGRPLFPHDRDRAGALESAAPAAAGRHPGIPGGAAGYSRGQPGAADRHLRLDGRPGQAAAAQIGPAPAGDADARAGPRRHRRLRRQRRPGAALHAGRSPCADPGGHRRPAGQRLDQWRRRPGAGLRRGRQGPGQGWRQPHRAGQRRRLQRRPHRSCAAQGLCRQPAQARHRADHPGAGQRQLQRCHGHAAGQRRRRQLSLHRQPAAGAQGLCQRAVGDPADHRQGRQGAGRIQPGAGGRVPPDRLREARPGAGGLQQ